MPVASPSASLEEKADDKIIEPFHWLGLSYVPKMFHNFLCLGVSHLKSHIPLLPSAVCLMSVAWVNSERWEYGFQRKAFGALLCSPLMGILISIPFARSYI